MPLVGASIHVSPEDSSSISVFVSLFSVPLAGGVYGEMEDGPDGGRGVELWQVGGVLGEVGEAGAGVIVSGCFDFLCLVNPDLEL